MDSADDDDHDTTTADWTIHSSEWYDSDDDTRLRLRLELKKLSCGAQYNGKVSSLVTQSSDQPVQKEWPSGGGLFPSRRLHSRVSSLFTSICQPASNWIVDGGGSVDQCKSLNIVAHWAMRSHDGPECTFCIYLHYVTPGLDYVDDSSGIPGIYWFLPASDRRDGWWSLKKINWWFRMVIIS